MNETEASAKTQVEITWRSVFRVLAGVLLAYVAVLLWPFFKALVLAILLAVALYPLVRWAERKGWPRWAGLSLASAALLLVIVGAFAIIGPIAFRQATALEDNLPEVRQQILSRLPASSMLRGAMENAMSSGTVADSRLVLEKTVTFVENTVGRLFQFVVIIGLAIYLMADGSAALKWLIVLFPARQRQKIATSLEQMAELIFAYVSGQFLISGFCVAYVFVLLTLLGVPLALLLGLVAGICDILPIIGFMVAVALAMLMGFTVSAKTAALIFVLYGAYHLFENFFIVPKVYGHKLKISTLTVPLAIAAGALLAGMVGAIAALPIVAAYPVIERLWLASKLAPDTLAAHEELVPR